MNKQEQTTSVAVIGSTSEAYARKEEVERCIFSADFMRFIMAQPSPDYWTPRPVPLVGACRYCGQTRPTAEAPAGSIKTQEDADEWASRTCDCEQGRRLANVWTARGRINALFADFSTDVRDMRENGRLNKLTEKIIEITPTPAGSIVTIYPTIEYKAVERRRREAAKRAERLAKVKSHAGGAVLIAGLVLALGTAGGLDCETISLAQGVAQLVASLVLVTIGSTAAGIFY